MESTVSLAPAKTTSSAISYRLLSEQEELREAVGVLTSVWGNTTAIPSAELLRAFSYFGNPVIGAFDEKELCGVCVGFLSPVAGLHLHSHVTGVRDGARHRGVGFGLKCAQRAWCLEKGIEAVTWTFDPMIARNAYFNIEKLGALTDTLLPDFYGDMEDAVNAGDLSDRLVVNWPIASTRVERALARSSSPWEGGAAGDTGSDGASPDGDGRTPRYERTVRVPSDYPTLRRTDPATARRLRLEVREQLMDAFASGLQVVAFRREGEYCLQRAERVATGNGSGEPTTR